MCIRSVHGLASVATIVNRARRRGRWRCIRAHQVHGSDGWRRAPIAPPPIGAIDPTHSIHIQMRRINVGDEVYLIRKETPAVGFQLMAIDDALRPIGGVKTVAKIPRQTWLVNVDRSGCAA